MDRHTTPPFMLQLFYRTGAFHRPDEFTTSPLPPHLTLHTWPDCTLTELTHQLAASTSGPILPDPAIGTRLAFRLIFPDTRGGHATAPGSASFAGAAAAVRYMVKDLGSVVIGDGGRGLDPDDADAEVRLEHNDPDRTLDDARFVVGDYISCAILPPLSDGSVAPASSARMGRGAGAGEVRLAVGRPPGASTARERENGYARAAARGRDGRGRLDGGFGGGGGGRSAVPMGEWRRGERLPEVPPSGRGRGRGRY
ncbi:Sin3 associated polypeptide p18-domain-containing protein [Xylariaceae sp. FL0662B]|nr:Sin3 associated polypeptide p18-domain-containing protein [Xylariaceae sp. FL0662B]